MKKTLQRTLLASALLVTASIYQNCSPMHVDLDNASFGKSLSSYVHESDVAWSTLGKYPELNRFNRVERWGDVQGGGINLYPALIPNSQTLNLDLSGLFESVEGYEYVRLGPGASLAPAVSDVSEFIFDRATILMVLRDIELPPQANGPLRLFSLVPANGDMAGILVIDVSTAENGSLDFTMVDWFDQNTYASRKINVPASELSGPIALAARFDKSASSLQLAINGRLSAETLITKGTVPNLGLVARSFVLHAQENTYGSLGGFSLGEFAMHKSSKSDGELAAISSQLGLIWRASQVVTPAPTPIVDDGTTTTSTDGAQLYTKNCVPCHGSLASSVKKGRTYSQITAAINTIPSMSGLSFLTEAQRQAIANALK